MLPSDSWAAAGPPWRACVEALSLCVCCTQSGWWAQSGAVSEWARPVSFGWCSGAWTPAPAWTHGVEVAWHAPGPSVFDACLTPSIQRKVKTSEQGMRNKDSSCFWSWSYLLKQWFRRCSPLLPGPAPHCAEPQEYAVWTCGTLAPGTDAACVEGLPPLLPGSAASFPSALTATLAFLSLVWIDSHLVPDQGICGRDVSVMCTNPHLHKLYKHGLQPFYIYLVLNT